MSSDSTRYLLVATTLSDRILELIRAHPKMMLIRDTTALLAVEDFKHDDIEASNYQLSWALSNAQRRYRMLMGIE